MSSVIIINQRYRLIKQIGKGSFGEIYYAREIVPPHRHVAVKLEYKEASMKLLQYEAELCRRLFSPDRGIPEIYWCGAQDDYYIVAMEMLGPSISLLYDLCFKDFSLKTVTMIAIQMLQIIQYIHNRGVIHRDIKPDNILIGLHDQRLRLIDYGLAKYYMSKARHIPFKQHNRMIGTARYSSINSHLGYELSRRDDLESLGYVLIYLFKGRLPWQRPASTVSGVKLTKDQQFALITKIKQQTKVDELCHGLPPQFTMYMNYVKGLEFTDKPDYAYLHSLFREILVQQHWELDYDYDWIKYQDPV